jgi:hypothetical protein
MKIRSSQQNDANNPITRLLASAADNPLLGRFIHKKRDEWESFQEHAQALASAVSRRNSLVREIESKRRLLDGVTYKVNQFVDQDEIETVLNGISNGGPNSINSFFGNMIQRVNTISVVKKYGPPLIEKIKSDLAAAEAALKKFEAENRDLLAEAAAETVKA